MTDPTTEENLCDEFDQLVSELVLDLLAADQRDRLLRHADTCARCRGELHSLAEVADLLPTLAPECEPPVGFESRVLAAVAPATPVARLRARVLVSAAAALLVAVALGAWVGATVTGDEPTTANTAVATRITVRRPSASEIAPCHRFIRANGIRYADRLCCTCHDDTPRLAAISGNEGR